MANNPNVADIDITSIDPELLKYASPEEIELLTRNATLAKHLISPSDYAEYVDRDSPVPFVEYRHIKVLNRAIVRLLEGRLIHPDTGKPVSNLMVFMPPRHGKSHFSSIRTPAWYLTNRPHERVLFASYEADFAANDFGAPARDLIAEHPEFNVHIKPDARANRDWRTTAGGGMKSAGAGGPITGKGGNLLICDDPHKNAEEAQSEVLRRKIHDWWHSTFFTRREPNAKTILIHTRWHEDDIGGHLLKHQPDDWYVLSLKALAEEDDPLRREPGEALCPERFNREALEALKASMPSAWVWEALYQQTPVVLGSGLFTQDSFNYYHMTLDPSSGNSTIRLRLKNGGVVLKRYDPDVVFATIDTADSLKTSADYTVVQMWAVLGDGVAVLLDQLRDRIESADHEERILQFVRRWNPHWLGVEKQSFGRTLIQNLQRRGVPVRELRADRDKFTRAVPAGGYMLAERMYLPANEDWTPIPWVTDLEAECLAFPNGAHDDQVDALSYAASVLAERSFQFDRPNHDISKYGHQPGSLEHRLEKYLDRKNSKRKRRSHPALGRL